LAFQRWVVADDKGATVIHPIVRIFASAGKAAEAVSSLKDWGFTSDQITCVSAATADEATKDLMAAYVLKARAQVYAQEIAKGMTAVVVAAPMGTGGAAVFLLNEAGPVSTRDPLEELKRGFMWDEAAPFSSTFRLPLISKFRPLGGIPAISKKQDTTFGCFLPELADPTPTTEKLGLPMLKR
jgi:hypothetical protein